MRGARPAGPAPMTMAPREDIITSAFTSAAYVVDDVARDSADHASVGKRHVIMNRHGQESRRDVVGDRQRSWRADFDDVGLLTEVRAEVASCAYTSGKKRLLDFVPQRRDFGWDKHRHKLVGTAWIDATLRSPIR